MSKTIIGDIEYRAGLLTMYGDTSRITINNKNIQDILKPYKSKKIKITIEEMDN